MQVRLLPCSDRPLSSSTLYAGRTNAFHVETESELARCYNDVSVMEHHHCALTFAILSRPGSAILAGLPPAKLKVWHHALPCPVHCAGYAVTRAVGPACSWHCSISCMVSFLGSCVTTLLP